MNKCLTNGGEGHITTFNTSDHKGLLKCPVSHFTTTRPSCWSTEAKKPQHQEGQAPSL